jgi:hypothetical protein
VFPPLGIAQLVTMSSMMYRLQTKYHRLVEQASSEYKADFVNALDAQSTHMVSYIRRSVWLLLLTASLFFSLFVFDMYGDETEYKVALGPAIVMMLFPALIWMYDSFFMAKVKQATNSSAGAAAEKNKGDGAFDVEMMAVEETSSIEAALGSSCTGKSIEDTPAVENVRVSEFNTSFGKPAKQTGFRKSVRDAQDNFDEGGDTMNPIPARASVSMSEKEHHLDKKAVPDSDDKSYSLGSYDTDSKNDKGNDDGDGDGGSSGANVAAAGVTSVKERAMTTLKAPKVEVEEDQGV